MSVSTAIKFAAASVALAAVSGLAFASWLEQGPAIFMAMIDTGLAWCF